MTAIEACPGLDDFRQLLAGKVGGTRQTPLLAHLERCPQCAETVQSLLKDDTLADDLRATPLLDSPPPKLVERILALNTDELHVPELGPYVLKARLGQGGMGIVYLAEDKALRREVALKVMKPSVAKSPAARERFLREARSAAAVRSDHVVTIFATGEDRGTAYVAMERLTGASLADTIDERLPIAECIRIGREMALGLAAAHEQGLVHRDIKPENVWREANGRIKLLDFGLARPVSTDVKLTSEGAVVGTPAFMAPEQAAGLAVDARSDLFSLGAVLYRLVSGRPAFEGSNIMAVLSALASTTPPAARSVNPDCPAGMEKLLARLLEKEPAKRPASARVVAEQLATLKAEVAPTRRLFFGLAAVPLAAVGYSFWPKREPVFEAPPPPVMPVRRELRLPPHATMFVGRFDLDPARTFTIEAFVTLEDERFPKTDAQQIFATDAMSVFAGDGRWSMGYRMTYLGKDDFSHFNGTDPRQNQRRHLAAVYLGPQLRLYLDGTLIASHNIGHDARFKPHKHLQIGGCAASLRFDEVRVSTIGRYTGNFTPKDRHEPDEHTFALYHLDETEGWVVADSSGRGNHGANHSGQWVAIPG